ncbi:uncharacterized protein K489DRAFT_97079 [Dissoconium aciculare CBS 342.82]|uniref:DUF7708 domain-containing protein n=1 Tax=Dissoconium aciculare CBS 342.82 TaxID=1314786 RepID=A0A6J3LRA9_9PEZI|nr:uncharacterized protein K489DRAFT_97079 [Dissoconium aciculare CBS 342.82]KAF1818381.1 hypothetical protein K489DRAFT_97079 [Dissoconium aciculare CBS 342.82]
MTQRGAVSTLYQCTEQDIRSQITAFRDDHGSELDRNAQYDSLSLEVRASMKLAGISKKVWIENRSDWSKHKSGAVLQKSITIFASFLENFSGIATIAKAADQQYGGIAFGTISLLLSVVVHKAQREQTLEDAFEEISSNLPRLDTLTRLRREESDPEQTRHFQKLMELIASTFFHIVQFARQATEYYGSVKQRWKDTLRSEPTKNKTIEKIRKNLQEIRWVCDMLMILKMDALQRNLSDMRTDVGSMRIDVSGTYKEAITSSDRILKAQSSWNAAHLTELRRLLNVPAHGDHTNLEHYKKILLQILFDGSPSTGTRHVRPKEITMDLLRQDSDFNEWWQSKKSCMFLAGGSNFEEKSGSVDLNWISLAAVLVVEAARKHNPKTAVYLAQTSFTVTKRKRSANWAILANIIYQLAEMHEDLLRSKLDTIQSAVLDAAWRSSNAETFMNHVHPLLVDILKAFSTDDEIIIVIDRLDKSQCAWEDDDECDSHTNMLYYMEGLLRIAADAHCRIKIFLTVDAARLRRTDRRTIVLPLARNQKEALLLKKEWCQVTEEVF